MNREEFEVALEITLQAVSEQYVIPLALALGTLTSALCQDPKTASAVADTLRTQAESCPPDVAGRALLQALAELASEPSPSGPAHVQNVIRSHLTLIRGGKRD